MNNSNNSSKNANSNSANITATMPLAATTATTMAEWRQQKSQPCIINIYENQKQHLLPALPSDVRTSERRRNRKRSSPEGRDRCCAGWLIFIQCKALMTTHPVVKSNLYRNQSTGAFHTATLIGWLGWFVTSYPRHENCCFEGQKG